MLTSFARASSKKPPRFWLFVEPDSDISQLTHHFELVAWILFNVAAVCNNHMGTCTYRVTREWSLAHKSKISKMECFVFSPL